jgi:hypothetical protein
VATLYVKSESNILVNDARYQLYVHSASVYLRKLPPSRDGLKEHIKRSAFRPDGSGGILYRPDYHLQNLIGAGNNFLKGTISLYSGPAHCRYQRSPSLKLPLRVDASLRVLNAVTVNVVLTI